MVANSFQQGGKVIIKRNIIKVNQRLEIILRKDAKEEHYQSRIEEITPNYMVIAMPMDKGYPILPPKGTLFLGKLVSEETPYQFLSSFIDKKLHPLPVWIISPPRDLKKMQQRAFVRIGIVLPVQIQIQYPASASDNEKQSENEVETICALTKDVSAGGIQIVLKKNIAVSTKMSILLNLPSFGEIQAMGEVVRVEQPGLERDIYWIAVKFIGLPENDRVKIIRFIFKKQLERRKKGV